MPSSRISLTRRSCSVLFMRSTRPFASGELAQINLMPNSLTALTVMMSFHRPGK
jgi:hypothetical protein